MQIKTEILQSVHLSKEMNVTVYGHFGIALLFFPSNENNNLQPERDGTIAALEPLINKGKIKVYTTDTIYNELWWNSVITEQHNRSKRHYEFNEYLLDELLPFIFDDCGSPLPILTAGADIGAFNAANTYFRRPDLFAGTIALSGNYNLQDFTNGYFDENCYFNSPVHYLPNLNDTYWMSHLLSRKHVYLLSGRGQMENPGATLHLSGILNSKGITNYTEIRDNNCCRNSESWNKIFADLINSKL